jgi:ribosome-binding protein aMBF1 (putative translation factor)
MADNRVTQDWEPVVLRKHQSTRGRGPSRTVSKSITDDFDPETSSLPKTSNRAMGLAIQQGRMAKGMKQAALDSTCNFPKGTTSSYESGKAIYKPNDVNKMARVLGITIPRPGKTGSKGKSKN